MATSPSPRSGPGLPPGARAWLLLDVDGVLNLEQSNRTAKELGLFRVRNRPLGGLSGTFTLHVQRWVGAGVNNHPEFAVAWCTSWGPDVDRGHPISIAQAAGFAKGLPWVDLRYYVDDPQASKVDGIVAFVGDDPFVWIDDCPQPGDVERLAALPNRHRFVRTDPVVGVTRCDIEQAARWAAGLPL